MIKSFLTSALLFFLGLISAHVIYCCLPVPVFQTRWGINDPILTAGVIPTIRKVAAANNLPVIDLYTPMLLCSDVFPDSINPNTAGTLKISELIAKAITEG